MLLAHPAAAALYFVKADTQSSSGLRIVEVVLGVLAAAGFGDDEAALIEGDLERTVLGLVLFETRRASLWASTEEQDARMREMRARLLALPPEEFPRVVASADVALTNVKPGVHTLTVTYYGDTHYRFGGTNVRMPEPKPRAVRH